MNISSRGASTLKLVGLVAVASGLAGIALWLSGSVSGAESRVLIKTAAPSIRFFAAAIMTATATILALLVPVLSFSKDLSHELRATHYNRVRHLGLLLVVTFVFALVLLCSVTLPLGESDKINPSTLTTIYRVLLAYVAAIAGAIVAIMWMLYELLRDFVDLVSGKDSELAGSGSDESA